jgi:hypothetical protein
MTSRERVLKREYDRGRMAAMEVQERSPDMNGTELYAVDDRIPQFKEAVKKQNMLTRKAGFVCKSSAGRVVRLLQPYDSSVYTAEPEELPAQYGFVWSDDPAKALPFVAISTSPYMKGNCCTENDVVFRSKIDNNVHAPSAWPQGWEKVEKEAL